MDKPEWILYVKARCPWCVQAVNYLRARNFLFTEVDVSRDEAAYELMRKISGQSYTPTLTIGSLLLADFGTDELEVFLKEHQLAP